LTAERLLELIGAGETLEVEFKGEERSRLSDSDLVEAAVCLANRAGEGPSHLLVGVEDDGRITGARARHESGRTDPQRVAALISNRTRPAITVRVDVVPIDDVEVISIEIPVSRAPVGTTDGRFLRRAIGGDGHPSCVPLAFHEMQSTQADRGLLDYSALVLESVSWSDLDPLEIERFRRMIRENRGRGDESLLTLSDVELAKALGAVEANHEVRAVRVLGALLFGREEMLRRALPTHEVAFQVLSGVDVESNDFFRWPILRAMEELESRLRARNREQEIMVGMLRVGVPDYSPRAFREAAANVLIHRDYTRIGAIHIQWRDDSIEISNPGGLPDGVRVDNILVTPPRPRNPLLADAFKRAGIVERTARGVDTIFREQLRNGRPAPLYGRTTESSVVLVLPGGEANLAFAALVAEESQADRDLSLDELLLLNELWRERRITVAEGVRVTQKSDPEVRSRLETLVERGLIEARGVRRGRSYHLSASTYRKLGKKSEYVRQRGFEPIQREQMILQYVEAHGRITRREVMELCQIPGTQARHLLNSMKKKGLLLMKGERRGAYYERPPKDMDIVQKDLANVHKSPKKKSEG
jgi:ATP-dependent DNA helicase RecG